VGCERKEKKKWGIWIERTHLPKNAICSNRVKIYIGSIEENTSEIKLFRRAELEGTSDSERHAIYNVGDGMRRPISYAFELCDS